MGKDLETERQIALPSDFVRLAIALLGRELAWRFHVESGHLRLQIRVISAYHQSVYEIKRKAERDLWNVECVSAISTVKHLSTGLENLLSTELAKESPRGATSEQAVPSLSSNPRSDPVLGTV